MIEDLNIEIIIESRKSCSFHFFTNEESKVKIRVDQVGETIRETL